MTAITESQKTQPSSEEEKLQPASMAKAIWPCCEKPQESYCGNAEALQLEEMKCEERK